MKMFLSLILLLIVSMTESFAQSPVSVSVITGSYTIPARKWARVVVNLEGSATFTISGTIALRSTQYSVLGTSVLQYGTSTSYGLATYAHSGAPTGSAFSSSVAQHPIVQAFEIPSGTVINGSGTWRAVVQLYER